MKKALILSLILGLFVVSAIPAVAQEQPAQQPTAEELEKEKADREKNAYRLLDQVIDEGQSLRTTENRVRIQTTAGDLIWKSNQSRARSLFAMAADGIVEMNRATTQPANTRGGFNLDFGVGPMIRPAGPNRTYQLRQELVLAVARHDAALAYQLLAATKPPPPPPTPTTTDPRARRQPQTNVEDSLEQTLMGRIAALDPKLAAQNAELMLDKGQFPRTLSTVISQLQKQDPEAAAKLAERTVKKIQSANILINNEAGNLAQSLLSPGPRQPSTSTTQTATEQQPAPTTQTRQPVLDQSVYVDLLTTVIDLALKATPQQGQNQQRGPNPVRTGGPNAPGRAQPATPSTPSESQIEQANARRLLAGLQPALPMIDQYVPGKSQLVRQKMTEMGMSAAPPVNLSQTLSPQGTATTDTLLQMASAAPPQAQSRLYQQAAYKALEEGNTDRARQIANDHLQAAAKDTVMQRIDFREMAKKTENTRIDDIRLSLGKLANDNERLSVLLQLAKDTEKSNPKLMTQLLEDARQMTNRRATSYEHFEQQLRVARAYTALDPARSFEVLDPGISQLNELLQAASVLSGFEINVFRDGEMTMQGGGGLTSTVSRYGQELALLARTDFERSETLAGRFQFPEARIMARLSIVQGLLGNVPNPQSNFNVIRSLGQTITIRP